MVVSPTQVRSLTGAEGQVVDGEFWREDPNQTRLFFGPSARPLKKGTGYLAVYEIFRELWTYCTRRERGRSTGAT